MSVQPATPQERTPLELVQADEHLASINLEGLNSTQRAYILNELSTLLNNAERLFGLDSNSTPFYEDNRGVSYLKPGTQVGITWMTDCFDAETAARAEANFVGNIPSNVQFGSHILQGEPLSPLHLAVAFAGFLATRNKLPAEQQTPVVFIGNAAPRAGGDPNSIGTMFVQARFPANVTYMGTLSEALSLVKDHIIDRKIFEIAIEHLNADTVYRSQYLPSAVLSWISGERGIIKEPVSLEKVADLEDRFRVFSLDSTKNIKTGLRLSEVLDLELDIGDYVEISINGVTRTMRYGNGVGDVKEGEPVFAKGSSFHNLDKGKDSVFDIYVNNGDAIALFTENGAPPKIGDSIGVKAAAHSPLETVS